MVVLTLAGGLPQPQHARVGEIDLFGTAGINVQTIRSALPIQKGDTIPEDQIEGLRDRINRATENAVGHKPTDVAILCCDGQGDLTIYIGLGGNNTAIIPLLPAPTGRTCLSKSAIRLYDDVMSAFSQAIQKGNGLEDYSKGYALSNDAVTRSKQLTVHEYAIAHKQSTEQALQFCGKPEHRQVAAWILGYAVKSKRQIAALVSASRDSDELVRNNAMRALWVLAESSLSTASEIPADNFIEMLNSGLWWDRNKTGLLLARLSSARNPRLLDRLRSEATRSLIEMARWENPGHAYPFIVLLGRIAGLEEARIRQLIDNRKVDEIITAVEGVH
jgi:hypothetical protein